MRRFWLRRFRPISQIPGEIRYCSAISHSLRGNGRSLQCRVVAAPAEPSVVKLAVNHADTDAERAKAYIGRLNAVLGEQLKPIVSELEADGFVADFKHSDAAGIVQCTQLTKTKVFT
jgi:hypothetical protein